MILADFWALADFETLISGHSMIHFQWKLCTRIYNFLFCCFMLMLIHRFAVSGYSSAKPKGLRSRLVEWALFFLCINKICKLCLSKGRLAWVFWRCRCVHIVYLAFSVLFLAFLRVDLAFFADDYLATLKKKASPFIAWSVEGYPSLYLCFIVVVYVQKSDWDLNLINVFCVLFLLVKKHNVFETWAYETRFRFYEAVYLGQD